MGTLVRAPLPLVGVGAFPAQGSRLLRAPEVRPLTILRDQADGFASCSITTSLLAELVDGAPFL
eukprot:3605559-Pyramimonas_sp.AAC.1